jgi:hypothetical protein
VLRGELQNVIEQLAVSHRHALSADAPASGFVQPDHIKLTVPTAFGVDTQPDAASAGEAAAQQKSDAVANAAIKPGMRLKVQAYHEGNPPPSGVVLGSIEIEFVIAAKR